MNEEDKKSEGQVEERQPTKRTEQKSGGGYWIVAGVVCFSKEQMREAIAGFRECAGR